MNSGAAFSPHWGLTPTWSNKDQLKETTITTELPNPDNCQKQKKADFNKTSLLTINRLQDM